jgi:DNA primase
VSSQTEQIKAKLGIVEVIGSYIKLEKAGSNFKARCPFHNEKTASFFVSPARDNYHCFGCNRGGDIFSFVQEIEGLDFIGSLEVLAAKAGVELKPIDLKLKTENERLYSILEEATKFYHTNLLQSEEAKSYVKNRQLTEETVRQFRIGFAKADWSALLTHLVNKGFKETDIEKTGLIILSNQSIRHSGGRYYDRFRGRVMFPLSDISSRTVGFSGRIVISTEREEAKYINTPQTALYDKSRILYGYDKAKTEIRQKDFCVLVEGQMDLVSSHQAGVLNTVAVSGTALTAYHLSLIKRLTDNLIMAFDGDTAGINAARRGINIALGLGMEVKIALLPDGMDPADLVTQNPENWKKSVAEATNVIDFYLAALARKNYDSRTLNKKISEEVLPYVARLSNVIDQAKFIAQIASFVGTREEPIWDELKKIRLEPGGLDTEFVASLPVSAKLSEPTKFSRLEMIERKLFSLLFWLSTCKNPVLPASELSANLEKVLGSEGFASRSANYESRREELILEAELSYEGNDFLANESEELLANLKEELLRQELDEIMRKIKQLESSGGGLDIAIFLKRCQEITKEINQLKDKG